MKLHGSFIADADNTGPVSVYIKGKQGEAASSETLLGDVNPGQTIRVDIGGGGHIEVRAHAVNKPAKGAAKEAPGFTGGDDSAKGGAAT